MMARGGARFQSPPGSGDNDGAIPTIWDPAWQTYNNLTVPQRTAFQRMPQALLAYADNQRWLARQSGTTADVTLADGSKMTLAVRTENDDLAMIGQMQQGISMGLAPSTIPFISGGVSYPMDTANATIVFTAVASFVARVFAAQAQIIDGINKKTITTRKQVDEAFAQVAPNSPSAHNPSPN